MITPKALPNGDSLFPAFLNVWALEPHRYRHEQHGSCCYDPKAIEWSEEPVISHWSLLKIRLFTHVTPYLRFAFCLNVRSSSYIRNLPSCKTVLMKVASMGLVRQSAIIMAVEIQRHMVCSRDCSFKSITSIVVRPLLTIWHCVFRD